MENIFKIEGYTFKKIKSNDSYRPYRVRCLETGEEKDGGISYNETASFLAAQYNYAKSVMEYHNKDIEYVKKVFEELLLNRYKSECDALVEKEIVDKGRLKGMIVSIISEDKTVAYKQYQTECFDIRVLFENGIRRQCTKIEISEK